MIKRLLLRILMFVVVLIMSVSTVVAVLLATEPGTRWVLAQAREATGVTMTHRRGSLLTGLTLVDIGYRQAGLDLTIDRLQFRWQPAGALWGLVVVDELTASGVAVTLPPGETSGDEPGGEISWPDANIPLAVVLRQLRLADVSVSLGDKNYRLQALEAEASYGPGRLRLDSLTLTQNASELALEGEAGLRYPYELEATLNVNLAPVEQSDAPSIIDALPAAITRPGLRGDVKVSGDIRALQWHIDLAQPARLSAEGRWRTGAGNQPQLTADIQAPNQEMGNFWLNSPALEGVCIGGTLSVDGWLGDYGAQFDGQVTYPGYETITGQLAGRGDTRSLRLDTIDLAVNQQRLRAEGSLGWRDGIVWQVDADAQALNPAAVIDGWPGKLNVELNHSGQWRAGQLQWQAQVASLAGKVRSLAATGSGQVEYSDGDWRFRDLLATLGGNKLSLNGELGERLDLDWSLNAPLLEQIDPAVGGQVSGQGQIKGTVRRPHMLGQLQGRELRWQDYRIEQLTLESTPPQGDDSAVAIDVRASDLTLGATELASVNAQLQGRVDRHSLQVELRRNAYGGLDMTFDGGWDGDTWRGQLSDLLWKPSFDHPLRLKQPAPVSVAMNSAQVNNLCLQSQPGEQLPAARRAAESTGACLSGSWQAGKQAKVDLAVERLPLSIAQRWLKEQVTVAGYLQGQGELDWQMGQAPTFTAQLQGVETELIYEVEEGSPERYPIRDLSVRVRQASGDLSADTRLQFVDYGQVSAQLSMALADQSLSGEVNAELDNLLPLEALLPSVRDIEGRLRARATLGGSLAQPTMVADARLEDVKFDLPALGIGVRDFNARAQGDQNALQANATLTSAQSGQLSLTLNARDVLSQHWRADIEVKGDRAQVIDIPELSLYASPDIKIAASAERIAVSGRTQVPKAHAVIKTLPESATKTSDDVVVIDSEAQARTRPGPALNMDVTLALGEEVSFDAAGFKARLGGDLSLRKEPQRPLYALGNITIIDGRFQAYGQDLSIDRGTLSFQGPIDDPGLNLTATRKVDNIEVGLIIGGTLQEPVTEIYSKPQQTESNAMALLFTGKPLDGASTGEASMLVNAVAKLGIKRGQFLADDIANRFGLDELTIKSEDDVNDSRLWLGKYLTEDLYVHYAIGLFNSISSVGLTYFIDDNWRLEAESGEVQSADIIFRMER